MPETAHSNAQNPPAAEHLAQLHKMSTTAGVTDTDYVSVNLTSVFALLLGLASGLAFFGMLLLVIPVVGVVVSIVAIRQISDSNGTQTGRTFAWTGLILSVACALGIGAMQLRFKMGIREDEKAIDATIRALGDHIRNGKTREAYDLFDLDFKSNWNPTVFNERVSPFQNDARLGKLDVFEWNGVTPKFETFGNTVYGATKVRLKFANTAEDRFDIQVVKRGTKWLISSLPAIFPADERPTKPADQFNI